MLKCPSPDRCLQVYHTLLVAFFLSLISCQQIPESNSAVQIIFDTDMGSDCDDVGALALLHHYADEGEAEILACLYSSGSVPYGAAVIEIINREYGRPEIPVGALHDTLFGDLVDKMDAEKFARDTAAYGHRYVHNFDTEELTLLARSILSGAEDSSIVYLTVGHTRGLFDLLISCPDSISPLNGYDLVQLKVKRWVALGALGALNTDGSYGRDWNFFFNESGPFTDSLVKSIPVPSYFVVAGNEVMSGKGLKRLPPGHIARTLYKDWLWNVFGKTLDDQRPSWDLAATSFAIKGTGKFLYEAETGYLDIDPVKGCRWIFDADSQHQHHLILQKEGTSSGFSDYLNDILSAEN